MDISSDSRQSWPTCHGMSPGSHLFLFVPAEEYFRFNNYLVQVVSDVIVKRFHFGPPTAVPDV
jgi:hypothetical protein